MSAVVLITAFTVLSWWLSRTADRMPPSRFGPVRLQAGLRASKAAQAAALAAREGCPLCEEMPCEAGPHFRWVTWVDHGSDHA